jgi:hypothetical protein
MVRPTRSGSREHSIAHERRSRRSTGPLTLVTAGLLGSLTLLGCKGLSADRGSRRTRGFLNREPKGATIGRDLRAAPPGTTIPATGLGVDLVESRTGRTDTFAPGNAQRGQVDRQAKQAGKVTTADPSALPQ